jgi:hypothetical protein
MSGENAQYKSLFFSRLALHPDSPLQAAHEQKAGVKRLCRGADRLLSRPGRPCDIASSQSPQDVATD